MTETRLVQTIWSFCHTLRDDGVSYLDYLEQITFLLFLKIIDDTPSSSTIPSEFRWNVLRGLKGRELEASYMATLQELSRSRGALGAIFDRAQNKIQDPAKLRRIIVLIDSQSWPSLGADTKGAIYEGLLQKNAEDTKSGAGQYFTPRPLIQAIVACVQPKFGRTVYDPACGTGGFFLAVNDWFGAHADWIREGGWQANTTSLTDVEQKFIADHTFHGSEIVASTRRLCLMNLYLRGIGSPTAEPLILMGDALVRKPELEYDYIFANPPFGSRSSMTSAIGEEDGDLTYHRPDFWAASANKQLNFVQHIATSMKKGGSAAIVIPDNVLFSAGAGESIRRKMINDYDLHTILRLPTGIFYAQGVRANVLFLERPKTGRSRRSDGVWVYDLRSGSKFTLRGRPMRLDDLADFVSKYSPLDRSKRIESSRFRFFSKEEVLKGDRASLDLSWTVGNEDESVDMASPEDLHIAVMEQLEAALEAYRDGREVLTRFSR